ncbi:MAG: ankyrin repeat domain-containing protein [Candidatus Adiutrix sp.]|jgi:ankyrin repeat protein|nr:ankyrin repeat domain-containing protein [Candidatus Adiutrix sp.]
MRVRNSVLTAVYAVLLCLGAAGISSAAMSDDDFIALCEKGTGQEIKAAIKAGANVNAKNEHGETPLHHAASNWYDGSERTERAVALLLEAGADVHARDSFEQTPLIEGANGYPGVVSLLLAAGSDVNAKRDDGTTALMMAAVSGSAESVSLLLGAGADVNAKDNDGQTPLMHAARNDESSEQAARLLLAAGADVHAKDNDGETALFNAARFSHTEAAQLLLAAGADVNVKNNDGQTPLLSEAMYSGRAKTAPLLLAAGADINAKANDGRTALMAVAMAAAYDEMGFDSESFFVLLDNGADPELTNPESKKAMDYVLETQFNGEEREMLRARLAGKSGGKAPAASAKKVLIRVDAAPDEISGEYDFFEEEYQGYEPNRIIFRANVAAKDFKFIAVEYDQEAGGIKPSEVLYSLDELLPEKPLVVTWMERGSFPHRGISFLDENNATRYFHLSVSGEDGSVLLVEFE